MSLLSRFSSLFRRAELNREIEREQEFHLVSRIDELIAEGLSLEEADRLAHVQFGSRVRAREERHEARLFTWLESAAQDVSYGLRSLAHAPAFAVVSIFTLALGIGANTAIFSVVNGVLLNQLPYPRADRIVSLFEQSADFQQGSISYPDFLDWQRMNNTFSSVAAYRRTSFNVWYEDGAEHLQGEMVSAGFFEIFGVRPLHGRFFTSDDDRLGAAPAAVITETLWRRKFGSRRDIVGQRLILDGVGRTIVGILPASFKLRIPSFQAAGSLLNDVYTPVGEFDAREFRTDRGAHWGLKAAALLKPGVSLQQARADMERVSRQLAVAFPNTDSNETTYVMRLREEIVGEIRPVLLLLLGAVTFVLLISCVNIANLLLARSTARQREMAVRLAIGAGRIRIVRQLITEGILLASLGGGLGLLLAKFGIAAALPVVPQAIPRTDEVHLDWRVLLFTAFVALTAGLLFGLAPAWKAHRENLASALQESGRSVAGARSRLQQTFVVLEIALALVLLVGAGLMIRSLVALWHNDPGFRPQGLMAFTVSRQATHERDNPDTLRAFFRQIPERVALVPGVAASSLNGEARPLESDAEWAFWFAGRPKPAHNTDLPMALTYVVGPGYLNALQIPLLGGRFLSESDTERSQAVAVIDTSLARKYFGGQDPIGQHLLLDNDPSAPNGRPQVTIVGVVGHVNQWGLEADAVHPLQAQIYLPVAQIADADLRNMIGGFDIFVRQTSVEPVTLASLRRQLLLLDRSMTLYHPRTLPDVLADSLAGTSFAVTLLSIFATLALVLAGVGIYGVLSYLVGQRTQEIGIRMAVGAARFDVLRLILTDGARMTLTGVALGVAAALGFTRLLSKMLFGVKPYDATTFGLVIITLSVIALLACYLPARRATRVDPLTALRAE